MKFIFLSACLFSLGYLLGFKMYGSAIIKMSKDPDVFERDIKPILEKKWGKEKVDRVLKVLSE